MLMKKINAISLKKLNNAEYAYFTQQVSNLIHEGTAEKLHVSAATLTDFDANLKLLTDIVAQSRISDETADIVAVDKEADDLITYILSAIRSAKQSPVAAQKAAATTLYNATKIYVGIQQKAQRQEVQQARGLLTDLAKPELKAHVQTLALQAAVDQLKTTVDRYATLLESRSASQVAADLGAAKPVREKMNDEYDEMTTVAFAFSIAAPAAELIAFVTKLNKLIDDTDTAYNQSRAQMKTVKGTGAGAGKNAKEIKLVESLIPAYEQESHLTPGVMKFTGLAAGTGAERAYKMVTDDVDNPFWVRIADGKLVDVEFKIQPGEPGGLTVEKLK